MARRRIDAVSKVLHQIGPEGQFKIKSRPGDSFSARDLSKGYARHEGGRQVLAAALKKARKVAGTKAAREAFSSNVSLANVRAGWRTGETTTSGGYVPKRPARTSSRMGRPGVLGRSRVAAHIRASRAARLVNGPADSAALSHGVHGVGPTNIHGAVALKPAQVSRLKRQQNRIMAQTATGRVPSLLALSRQRGELAAKKRQSLGWNPQSRKGSMREIINATRAIRASQRTGPRPSRAEALKKAWATRRKKYGQSGSKRNPGSGMSRRRVK